MSEPGLVIDPDEPGGSASPIQAAVDAGPPVIPLDTAEGTETATGTPPDDEDDALEAEAVTVQGGKFAPLAAIKESRKA
ncbi:MAG: hypothetical protein NUW01_01320, partial [Gemmatimonadaceae bacterium]|nr:hypothetical protein [Gemmatimonadaceae bacterium]